MTNAVDISGYGLFQFLIGTLKIEPIQNYRTWSTSQTTTVVLYNKTPKILTNVLRWAIKATDNP